MNNMNSPHHIVLISGGAGYIGSHTVVELHAAGYDVVVIDNLSNSNIDVLDGIEKISGKRPMFVQGDCTDMDTLRKLFSDNRQTAPKNFPPSTL